MIRFVFFKYFFGCCVESRCYLESVLQKKKNKCKKIFIKVQLRDNRIQIRVVQVSGEGKKFMDLKYLQKMGFI